MVSWRPAPFHPAARPVVFEANDMTLTEVNMPAAALSFGLEVGAHDRASPAARALLLLRHLHC